jgi:tRNA(Ile)-lysidine synthase
MFPIKNIEAENALKNGSTHILACSGGVDSVLLAHWLKHCGIKFIIAHVNFNLRGNESQKDQDFVENLANELQVPFKLATTNETDLSKLSKNIQESARIFRYQFFNSLIENFSEQKIILGHHKNDKIETALQNLLTRGTGLKGLVALKMQNENLVRPLIALSKTEIYDMAKTLNIHWREDQSNNTNKYTRNKFRNQLVPFLENLHPGSTQNLQANLKNLESDFELLNFLVEEKFEQLTQKTPKNGFCFKPDSFSWLLKTSALHYFLSRFGVNQTQQTKLFEAIKLGRYSKRFDTENYYISLMRNGLWVEPKGAFKPINCTLNQYLKEHYDLFLVSESKPNNQTFPLSNDVENLFIRNPKQGDKIAIKKGNKLVSDCFKEGELPLHQRPFHPLLVNEKNEVLWVLGVRISNLVVLNSVTSEFLKFRP